MDFRTAISLLRGSDTLSRVNEYGQVYTKGIRVDAWGRIAGEDGRPWSPSVDDLRSNEWRVVSDNGPLRDLLWAIDEALQGQCPARKEWLYNKYCHHLEVRGNSLVIVSKDGDTSVWTPNTLDEILAEDWIVR
jgi:hypothetical protein